MPHPVHLCDGSGSEEGIAVDDKRAQVEGDRELIRRPGIELAAGRTRLWWNLAERQTAENVQAGDTIQGEDARASRIQEHGNRVADGPDASYSARRDLDDGLERPMLGSIDSDSMALLRTGA
jgi:hypothetical protein